MKLLPPAYRGCRLPFCSRCAPWEQLRGRKCEHAYLNTCMSKRWYSANNLIKHKGDRGKKSSLLHYPIRLLSASKHYVKAPLRKGGEEFADFQGNTRQTSTPHSFLFTTLADGTCNWNTISSLRSPSISQMQPECSHPKQLYLSCLSRSDFFSWASFHDSEVNQRAVDFIWTQIKIDMELLVNQWLKSIIPFSFIFIKR